MNENDEWDFIIPNWIVLDKETGEVINTHSGVVLNAICIKNTNGTVSVIGTSNLICGEACWYKGRYLVCVEPITDRRGIATGHIGNHRDRHGIVWPDEECIRN